MSLQPFELEVGGARVAGLRNHGDGPRAGPAWLARRGQLRRWRRTCRRCSWWPSTCPGMATARTCRPVPATPRPPRSATYDVADALGWDRFSLLGHSMGAGIASLTASVSDRVERLVAIEALGACVAPRKKRPTVCVNM